MVCCVWHFDMDFRIADTFIDSLVRLTGDEQKGVKTTAFERIGNSTAHPKASHPGPPSESPFWHIVILGLAGLTVVAVCFSVRVPFLVFLAYRRNGPTRQRVRVPTPALYPMPQAGRRQPPGAVACCAARSAGVWRRCRARAGWRAGPRRLCLYIQRLPGLAVAYAAHGGGTGSVGWEVGDFSLKGG